MAKTSDSIAVLQVYCTHRSVSFYACLAEGITDRYVMQYGGKYACRSYNKLRCLSMREAVEFARAWIASDTKALAMELNDLASYRKEIATVPAGRLLHIYPRILHSYNWFVTPVSYTDRRVWIDARRPYTFKAKPEKREGHNYRYCETKEEAQRFVGRWIMEFKKRKTGDLKALKKSLDKGQRFSFNYYKKLYIPGYRGRVAK